MYIRHFEQIFSIDKVVPVDLFQFLADTITMLFIQVSFTEAINFLVDPYYQVLPYLMIIVIIMNHDSGS